MKPQIITEILDFLRELGDNNNREWFNAHKDRYLLLKQGFDVFTGKMIERIALFDESVKGVEVKDCTYRIYRDVRFSPNKSPYKTHFAAFIAPRGGRNSRFAGYYIHIQPEGGSEILPGSFLSGGIYCPEPALLKRLRQDVYDNVDEFKAILQEPGFVKEFKGIESTDVLKRVPSPFPADFPDGDLLKHKHYTAISQKPESFFADDKLVDKIGKVFEKLAPFNRFLNYTVENE